MNLYKPDTTNCKNKVEFKNSCRVLESGYKSALSVHNLFNQLRLTPTNTARRGGTKTTEQDLLRAMLLFTSSTLDSTIKELIKGCLEKVVMKDVGARKQLEDFVEKKIRKDNNLPDDLRRTEATKGIDTKYVASILVSDNPLKSLTNDLIDELTKDSLQSVDQLLRIAAYFAITKEEILEDVELVKRIFKARNEITHEMDIQPNKTYLTRRPRKETDMVSYSNELLKITEKFIQILASKLYS